MQQFRVRLNQLIETRGKARYLIAQEMGIRPATLTDYVNGVSLPHSTNLDKICRYFNCSSDYLMGRTNYRTHDLGLTPENYKKLYSSKALQNTINRIISGIKC